MKTKQKTTTELMCKGILIELHFRKNSTATAISKNLNLDRGAVGRYLKLFYELGFLDKKDNKYFLDDFYFYRASKRINLFEIKDKLDKLK